MILQRLNENLWLMAAVLEHEAVIATRKKSTGRAFDMDRQYAGQGGGRYDETQ